MLIPGSALLWLLVLALPVVWLWPRLLNPSFGMIDDPHDLKYFRSMQVDFIGWLKTGGLHGEVGDGRYRPLYWILRFIFYYLPAGLNPTGWVYIHYVNLACAITVFFLTIQFISRNVFVAFVGCLLWIFSANAIENYSRLATQEIWQVLWLGFLFLLGHFIFSKKQSKTIPLGLYLLLAVVLFLLYFSKETSLVMLPFSMVMLCLSLGFKKGRREWLLFSFLNLLFTVLFFACAPSRTGYASHYQFSFSLILQNLKMFFFELQWHYLLLVLLVAYLLRLYRHRGHLGKRPIEQWQFAFLALGLAFWGVYLPWTEHVRRYLLVSDFLFAGFMALELMSLILPFKLTSLIPLCLSCFLAYTSSAQMPDILKRLYTQPVRKTKGPVYAMQWFCQKAKANANVLVFELEPELTGASILFIQDFFQRKDLTIYSLSEYAQNYQRGGYNIVSVDKISEEVMDKIDYIFWSRRGIDRAHIDQFHQYIMHQLNQSKYRYRMNMIYNDVDREGGPLPEGTEIWELKREK
ncbi:MAG: hypothetical protein NC930_00105 [Candidatus Omnitrophica bacterium]|nr:hypothetical protein [Candidatus Omnitrophota bacterium]